MNITEKETVDYFASLFGTKLTKKDVYSYDTRIPQAKGRTEKQDEEYMSSTRTISGICPGGRRSAGSCIRRGTQDFQNEPQGNEEAAPGL